MSLWLSLRYTTDILLEGLMKSIENLHQDSRRPGWHMNQVPPTHI